MNGSNTTGTNKRKHLTAPGADGCFYCRSLRTHVEGAFCFCEECPLFGGFESAPDGKKAAVCIYADADEKEFPDYLPTDADDGEKLIQKAIQFAAEAHKGDFRKGNHLPYIVHPMEVMGLVRRMTDDCEVIAAGALHDVVEDTPYTVDDIRERFGDRVAKLVDLESENKRPDRPKSETWRIRKEESLLHDKDAPIEAKYIMLADKLSNMRATLRDFQKDGHKIWQKFNMKDEAQQEWYYRTVAEVLKGLEGEPLYREYLDILEQIFG